MASDPAPRTVESAPVEAPLSGSGAQAMQRLQVGLFGLAAMVLLVGLANIFITNARHNDAQSVVPGSSGAAAERSGRAANDPLADAGVVPDMAANAGPKPADASPPAGP